MGGAGQHLVAKHFPQPRLHLKSKLNQKTCPNQDAPNRRAIQEKLNDRWTQSEQNLVVSFDRVLSVGRLVLRVSWEARVALS